MPTPPENVQRDSTPRMGERRLPMALAVVAVGVLFVLIPEDFRFSEGTKYAYPALLLVLLLVLTLGDPGRIDRQSQWLRWVTGILLAIITVGAVASVLRLVVGILEQAEFTTPGQLLAIGGAVWLTIVIAFALWYWHLDRGGPAARARGDERFAPAWHFPEEELASTPPGWFPQFVDYFALSFNTATAFSPTDVAAIRHWAKLVMILESAISLTLVALVVARAVNAL
jgi:uncharacterized membrane protein